ncbi:peptidoglycan-binding domain-containing protein [Scytonema sp. NUACC21]
MTTSAVRDLQRRYRIPVTGRVNPTTWEVLDMHENPYRSPLPWKQQNRQSQCGHKHPHWIARLGQ